jgi:2-amino-4-hydroxy-6-hydroxymethyldihydropteridine diphosphokinase
MQIVVGLGSNLGDRLDLLQRTLDWLRTLDPGLQVAPFYESAPVGCPPGSPPFLNTVAVLDWSGDPLDLLDRFQDWERQQGRPGVRPVNAPRPVDLDILLVGDRRIDHPRLAVPHPRMTGRLFVLEPLADLWPDFPLPHTGRTVQDHLRELRRTAADQTCRRLD